MLILAGLPISAGLNEQHLLVPDQALDLDLGAYDGIALTVVGDGQTYKLNLKTADQEDTPESTYQATFDTPNGTPALALLCCCLVGLWYLQP